MDARKVGLQDQVQLTLTVEGTGAPDEVPLPALVNLDVVSGPHQSSQVSIVNGRMSQSRSLIYVLQPRAVGKAEVGAAHAGGQSAAAIAIEVVAGSVRAREPAAAGPVRARSLRGPARGLLRPAPRPRRDAPAADAGRALAHRLKVGEPLVLTYWLYTQTSVADLQFKEAPQFAGFWVEELERAQGPPSGEPATVEGQSYRRFPVLKKLLFPTKAGTLTIPASVFRIGLARTGFFDSGGSVERATKPISVEVGSLPDEPGFSGAVGKFRATASLDRDAVPLGEAATLRFRVEGTGNLKWIDRGPELVLPGAKVFPPQSKSDLRTTPSGITGSRTWEFVVVPETSGVVEIPPLPFRYFDPAAGRIVTAETQPLALQVEGGTGAAGPLGPPTASAVARATGALPLRSDLGRPAPGELSSRALVAIVGLVLLLHAGLWGADRLRGGASLGTGRTASPRSVRGGAARAGAGRARRHEQGAGGLARREGARRGLRCDSRRGRERAGACGPGAPRRRSLRPLRAPARRLLGQGERPGRARGRGRAEMGVRPRASSRSVRCCCSPRAVGGAGAGPADDRFREANELVRSGDYPRAIALYGELARSGGESATLYWNWAQAATARGAHGEALWALLRARELDPGDRAVARDVERLRGALNLDPAEIAPEPLAVAGRFSRRFRLDLVAAALLALSVLAPRARPDALASGGGQRDRVGGARARPGCGRSCPSPPRSRGRPPPWSAGAPRSSTPRPPRPTRPARSGRARWCPSSTRAGTGSRSRTTPGPGAGRTRPT